MGPSPRDGASTRSAKQRRRAWRRRWTSLPGSFEALGHDLGVRDILAHGGSPLGPPLLRAYGDAGTQATGTYWLYLAAFVVVFSIGAWVTLVRRCRRSTR